MRRLFCFFAIAVSIFAFSVDYELFIDLDRKGPQISPALYGIFIEDINHGIDGGLYAELVRNRSFEHTNPLEGWLINIEGQANAVIESVDPIGEQNKNYMKISIRDEKSKVILSNAGYDGFSLEKNKNYLFSVFAKGRSKLNIILHDAGIIYANVCLEIDSNNWRKYELELFPAEKCENAVFSIEINEPSDVSLDMISLISPNSWNKIMRNDLVEMLQNLQPGFMRFPGGCLVEGYNLENAYRWKDTIGPVEYRKTKANLWGYYQSYGVGFHEYFLLCEHLSSEPVPVVNAGISCQVRGAQFCPVDQIDEWVQDALDLIEYANGSTSTVWGNKRMINGHEKPFNLKYLGIGNENWGGEYQNRFKIFQQVIKEKYPDIKLIFSCPPEYEGPIFDEAITWAKSNGIQIIDEHIYAPFEWFLANADRYDSYDRNGPKVMIGEYACHVSGRRNNLQAALAEAAFMTGLERNSDVVVMASYAPLFNRVGWSQWTPDLIWFDASRVYGTPSYYVQKMFSTNLGDVIIYSILSPEDQPIISGMAGLGSWKTQVEFDHIKISNFEKILLYDDFAKNEKTWQSYRGIWKIDNGVLKQTSLGEDRRAYFGEKNWTDYAIEVRARKISGSEGFLVFFGVKNDQNYYCWNIGGWNNSISAVQKSINGEKMILAGTKPLKIDTNKWYDIRIELNGENIKCYLNGQLIHDINDFYQYKPLYQVCSYDYESGDIILKVVNPWPNDKTVKIEFNRKINLHHTRTITITSNSYADENSFITPENVFPYAFISEPENPFIYIFKKYSVTILRMNVNDNQ